MNFIVFLGTSAAVYIFFLFILYFVYSFILVFILHDTLAHFTKNIGFTEGIRQKI